MLISLDYVTDWLVIEVLIDDILKFKSIPLYHTQIIKFY
jgi:hypothetical protein